MTNRTPAKAAVHAFKKELILEAACTAFYTRGYAGAKLDDVAQALDVTKPFIYYHFPSKLHLLEEICDKASTLGTDLAQAALADTSRPFLERFNDFLRQFVLRVIERRMVFAIYFRDASHLPEHTRERLRQDRRDFHAALRALLNQGKALGVITFDDLSITEQTVTGMAVWIFNWYRPEGAAVPDSLADHMVALISTMLGAKQINPAHKEKRI